MSDPRCSVCKFQGNASGKSGTVVHVNAIAPNGYAITRERGGIFEKGDCSVRASGVFRDRWFIASNILIGFPGRTE
jgi:hypothetical protein